MILYSYINCHAGTPSKAKTENTMSLDNSSICYIGSRAPSEIRCASYRLTSQETRFCFLIIIRRIAINEVYNRS